MSKKRTSAESNEDEEQNENSELNWFGQVGGGGRATQPRPQVAAPSLSQIPGLSKASGDTSYTDEPQRPFYRDTDSAYVRLAKQGGRTDLLRMDQDAAPVETKGSGYTIPSWMQKDSVNEDMHNAVEHFPRAQDTCFPPAMVTETMAAYTGDTLYKAWSRNSRGTSPSHQFLRKRATVDLVRTPALTEARFTIPGKHRELEETVKPGYHESSHHLKTEPQALEAEAALPRTPAYSTLIKASDQNQLLRDEEKPSSMMRYRSEPISGAATEAKDEPGSDMARFCRNNMATRELEVQRQNEETPIELVQQTGSFSRRESSSIDEEMRNEAGDAGTELQHEDSTVKDKDELDFNDNASRADQWDSRQSSPPPPGDQGSNYSWSRKMSAEGDRQPMQTESQSAYANKQSRDVESPANWRSDQFQQQYSRQNISDAASEASRSSYQSPEHKARDNTRPDWLQWNPANNGRRESANGRQYEENAESRGSAYGQRYQGNGSPQKPFADHGYQLPMSTETSSAYSEKPFQSPAGGRRSSTSKEDFYSKSTYPASSSSQQRPSLTPNHEQQPAGINRLKHADSMSKIMSFGYLKDAEQGDSNHLGAGRSQPKLDQDYVANTYTTEYKEKMHHGTGDATPTNSIRSQNTGINSTGGYVPTPISDPGYRRRRQSMDERPDFFKIGSTEPQSVPAYGIRKPSAESRPDFFGSDRGSTAAALSYGKIKHDAETKPDFFKNGSLDNYMERQVEDKKPDDGGILDKLNGYHGISQKANFRRRKMDINGPMLTMPVKAISRF